MEETLRFLEYDQRVYDKIEHLKSRFAPQMAFINSPNVEQLLDPKYSLPSSKIKALVSDGYIRTKNPEKLSAGIIKYVISAYDVAKYCIQQALIKENCYYFVDFVSLLRGKSVRPQPLYHELVSNLGKLDLIKVIQLSPLESIGRMDKFITKASVEIFLKKYISLASIQKEFGIANLKAHLPKMEEKIGILNPISGGLGHHYRFVQKEDFLNYRKYHVANPDDLLSELRLGKELGLSGKTVKQAIKDYHLFPVSIKGTKKKIDAKKDFQGRAYYHPNDLELLLKEQKRLWDVYCNNYYSSREFEEITKQELNLKTSSREFFENSFFSNYEDDEGVRIPVPSIIRIKRDDRTFKEINFLFKKEVVDKFIESSKFQREYIELSETLVSDPLLAYRQLIKHLDVTFPKGSHVTEDLWNSFVQRGLENRSSDYTILRTIRDYAQVAKFLSELLSAVRKDIAFMTTSEIKLAIFNDKVTVYVKGIMYSFLYGIQTYYVGKGTKVLYDLAPIPNPYHSTSGPIKDVYSKEEYGAFCNYINQVEMHKHKAIEDIEKLLKGNRSGYKQYASMWLYVAIHLNNKWRRFEITLFPRIDGGIKNTNLLKKCNYDYKAALSYLKNNNLDESDIQYIADKLKAFLAVHNKNKMPRDFTWAEPTALSLTTAIILCEIRCELELVQQEYMIDFNSKKRAVPEGSEKAFFESFNEKNSLEFASLKMNRSLSSLSYEVGREMGISDVWETTKSLRNHKKDQSLNIYLTISRERLDDIAGNLFNAGPFGFVHTSLRDILYKQNVSEKLSDSRNLDMTPKGKQLYANQLRTAFGDWIKIEEVVRMFSDLEKNQNHLKDFFNSMSNGELVNLYSKMIMGVNHAKDEGFQCIFADCIDVERSCVSCPFMTMNFHTLTVLANDFTLLIRQCELKFMDPSQNYEGEKLYATRLLAIYTHRIREAISHYGEGVVSTFFKNGLDFERARMKEMSSLSTYKDKLKEIDNSTRGR